MNYVSTRDDLGPDFMSLLKDTVPARSIAEERLHRKQRLAGHVTARDPEHTDSFWVNPLGLHFGQIRVRDLIRVEHSLHRRIDRGVPWPGEPEGP